MWTCHVDDSAKGRYYMILGRDMLTASEINQELSEHVIKAYDGPLKESTAPMVDLSTYQFKDLNTGKLHRKNRL